VVVVVVIVTVVVVAVATLIASVLTVNDTGAHGREWWTGRRTGVRLSPSTLPLPLHKGEEGGGEGIRVCPPQYQQQQRQ
jgi:hypothetical protein